MNISPSTLKGSPNEFNGGLSAISFIDVNKNINYYLTLNMIL
jgi:hypothetical protein